MRALELLCELIIHCCSSAAELTIEENSTIAAIQRVFVLPLALAFAELVMDSGR